MLGKKLRGSLLPIYGGKYPLDFAKILRGMGGGLSAYTECSVASRKFTPHRPPLTLRPLPPINGEKRAHHV